MVKARTMRQLLRTAKTHVKVRHVWTQVRARLRSHSSADVEKLAKAFAWSLTKKDAPYLRRVCKTIHHKRYRHRRWAPVHPARASVFQAQLGVTTRLEPQAVLFASIRARLFCIVSARKTCWRCCPLNPYNLPYKPFGKALSLQAFRRAFVGTLSNYDNMIRNAPVISRKKPLTVSWLSKQLGFRGPAWIASVILNDVSLTCGERFVRLDEDYKNAQLMAGGVKFGDELLSWKDLMRFKAGINKGGRMRSATGGTFRVTEVGHVVCETRQFANNPIGKADFTPDEKESLCHDLALWCVRNSVQT